MTPEEKMILFAVLQDIADELRRIECEERKAKQAKEQEHTETSKDNTQIPYSFPSG